MSFERGCPLGEASAVPTPTTVAALTKQRPHTETHSAALGSKHGPTVVHSPYAAMSLYYPGGLTGGLTGGAQLLQPTLAHAPSADDHSIASTHRHNGHHGLGDGCGSDQEHSLDDQDRSLSPTLFAHTASDDMHSHSNNTSPGHLHSDGARRSALASSRVASTVAMLATSSTAGALEADLSSLTFSPLADELYSAADRTVSGSGSTLHGHGHSSVAARPSASGSSSAVVSPDLGTRTRTGLTANVAMGSHKATLATAASSSAAATAAGAKTQPRTAAASTGVMDVEAAQPLARDSFRRALHSAVIDSDYFAPKDAAARSKASIAVNNNVNNNSLTPATATEAAPTLASCPGITALSPTPRAALLAAAAAAAAVPVSAAQSLAALRQCGVRVGEALDLDALALSHTAAQGADAQATQSESLSQSLSVSISGSRSSAVSAVDSWAAETAAAAAREAEAYRALNKTDAMTATADSAVVSSVAVASRADWSAVGVPADIAALRDSATAPLTMPQLVLVIKALMQDGPARADLRKVASALARYDAEQGDWQRYAFCDDAVKYTRNLVTTDNKYWTLLLLCWNTNKESPVHNHPDCECFVRCLSGAVTETLYAWPPADAPPTAPLAEISHTVCGAGGVTFMNDSKGLHKLANNGAETAVTLHLYFPPYQRFKMFLDCTAKASEGSSCFHSKYGALVDNLAGLGLPSSPCAPAAPAVGAPEPASK